MKQSGKKIGLVCLTLLCCFCLALPVLAATTDRYTNMEFDMTLLPDGNVQIVQTSTAYFPSNYSTAYFELERKGFSAISDVWVKVNGISAQRLNLPDLATRPGYFYYSDEGDPYAALDAHPELKGRYTVQTVPNEYKSGNPYFEWYIEKQKVDFTFQVGYTAVDVVQVYADTAEFSWMPVSSKNSFPIENVLVRVHIPEGSGITKNDILAWGHGPLSGEVYIVSPTLVTFKVDKLAAGDYLDLRLAMPTQLFPQAPKQTGDRLPTILSQEENLAKEANIERTKARLQLIAPAACLLILILLGFFTRRYVRKANRPYTPQQEPEYFRDLPSDAYPALVSELYHYPKGERAEYKSQRLTATLLDLAARGVIAIEQTEEKGFLGKKRNTVITRLKATGAANDYETKLMQILFEFVQTEENRVSLKELSAYGNKHAEKISHAFEELEFTAEADLEKYGYMDYAPLSPMKPFFKIFMGVFVVSVLLYFVWHFLGIFLLVAGLIILPLFAAGLKRERLSQKAADEKALWHAFRKFLEDFTLFEEKELPELVVWQRFLAYAAALGVAERVLEQLPVKYPILNTNEGQMQYVYLYYMIHAHQMGALGGFAAVSHLSTELSSVHANAERVIAAARSRNSGGSGHGGGFSGGGGFGGGGGSFGAR